MLSRDLLSTCLTCRPFLTRRQVESVPGIEPAPNLVHAGAVVAAAAFVNVALIGLGMAVHDDEHESHLRAV
jgi:hypothetical protein